MPCAIAFVSFPALGAMCRTYYGAPCSAELLKLDLSARLILDCLSSRSLAESHKSLQERRVRFARSSTHSYDIFAMSDALTDVKYPV